jgi:hypothetical protein
VAALISHWWGTKGDGGTNDTVAFQAACAALQAMGGGHLHFPYGDYQLFEGTTGPLRTILGDFSNLTGVVITSDGATFTNTRIYASTEYGEIFRFTGCYNVVVDNFYVNSTQTLPTTASVNKELGVDFLSFYGNASRGGSRNIRISNVKLRNVRLGVGCFKLSTEPISYKTMNIDIDNMETNFCAYAINCQFSGDNLRATINSKSPHRTYSVYGVKNHEVRIRSEAQDADDCFIGAFEGYGCENMDIWYSNCDSSGTPVAQAAAPGSSLYFGDQTPAVHKNIRFRYNCKWPVAGYFGIGLHVYKYNNASAYDTVDRGHTIDGLDVSGYFEGNPGPSNSPPIFTSGTWGTGEFVRNVHIHDLRLKDTASSTLTFLNSLDGPCVIENVHAEANLYLGANKAGTRVVCINVRAPNLTADTAHAGYHSYYACEITDASLQSIVNKTFEGKTRILSVIQPNAQEVVGVRSLTNTSLAKMFLSDAAGGSIVDSHASQGLDVRLSGGAGGTTRNLLAGVAQSSDVAAYSDLQLVLSNSIAAASQSIALAILADGTLSLRRQSGAVAANTLLSTETLKLSAAVLRLIGQIIQGNSTSGGNLLLESTSHATKGKIGFGGAVTESYYDEVLKILRAHAGFRAGNQAWVTKTLTGSLTGTNSIFRLKPGAGGSLRYRLHYHLIADTTDGNPATRSETFGIKSGSIIVSSLGVPTQQVAPANEVTERSLNTASVVTVTLATGDATAGAYMQVACTNYNGANALGVFMLEALVGSNSVTTEVVGA